MGSQQPFDCLVQQLEDGQDYADDGGQPYTDQLLHIAYTLVFKTGLYFEDCKAWNAKPNNEKTWTTFKTHFHHAQRLFRDQLRTTKQAGFTSNVAIHNHPKETQQPPEYCEALVNLATSAAKDRELLTTLATTVANTNDHIQHLNKPPIASVNNNETTSLTALSSITSSVTDLQQQLADLKRENEQLHNKQTRCRHTRRDNRNYCWTHGHRVRNKLTSAICQNKAPGHQDNATSHVISPWAAAKPTNPTTLESEGGVFPSPLLN